MTAAKCPDCKSTIVVVYLMAGVAAHCSKYDYGQRFPNGCGWTGTAKPVGGAGHVISTKAGRWLGHSYDVRR